MYCIKNNLLEHRCNSCACGDCSSRNNGAQPSIHSTPSENAAIYAERSNQEAFARAKAGMPAIPVQPHLIADPRETQLIAMFRSIDDRAQKTMIAMMGVAFNMHKRVDK